MGARSAALSARVDVRWSVFRGPCCGVRIRRGLPIRRGVSSRRFVAAFRRRVSSLRFVAAWCDFTQRHAWASLIARDTGSYSSCTRGGIAGTSLVVQIQRCCPTRRTTLDATRRRCSCAGQPSTRRVGAASRAGQPSTRRVGVASRAGQPSTLRVTIRNAGTVGARVTGDHAERSAPPGDWAMQERQEPIGITRSAIRRRKSVERARRADYAATRPTRNCSGQVTVRRCSGSPQAAAIASAMPSTGSSPRSAR